MKISLALVFGLFSLVWLLYVPETTYAHFLATDKNIGVVFHVDPDDDPIPGQSANLYFLFGDKTHRFNLATCHCIVNVTEQGKQIFSQPLITKKTNKPSVWGTSIPFTFPNRDVYSITIQGTPVETNAFQSFTISWDFRVDQHEVLGVSTQASHDDPTFIYFAIGFLSIPLFLGIGLFFVIRH